MTFEDALEGLRAGRIEFGEFITATRPRWKSIALDIMRRWRVPGWVAVEDVEQELHLAAWRFVWQFDEKRGSTLAKYVVWNAYDKAKKKVHKARGARLCGSADRNPGHIDVPLVRWGDDADAFVDALLNAPPKQEEVVARIEAKERAKAQCKTERERLVVEELVGSDSIVDVAMLLYADPVTRLACRLSSERHACRVVEKTVERLVGRLEAAA
jgi:DNA-directed RNA polymerase specialized sigma24 family protein